MAVILRNDLIQGALIAHLKTITEVTNVLVEYGGTATDIREDYWGSDDNFGYPNIRLRMIDNQPLRGECSASRIVFSWMAFAQDQSSFLADKISGIISKYFHNSSYSTSLQGVSLQFSVITTRILPATKIGNVWRAEVLVEGLVSQTN